MPRGFQNATARGAFYVISFWFIVCSSSLVLVAGLALSGAELRAVRLSGDAADVRAVRARSTRDVGTDRADGAGSIRANLRKSSM